jgi:Uma2 family endonuclease
MSTVLVSLSEYLDTDYSPDREYVDGVVMERHVGEYPHSCVQSNLIHRLRQRHPAIGVWPEPRVTTVPGRRNRIPDVCVTLSKPRKPVLDTPPYLAIEILSRRDEMTDVLEKLSEYVAFGIPYIWLIDPWRQKAYRYEQARLEEVAGATISAGEFQLEFVEIFEGL